jgi:hypothetical protein
MQLEKKTILTLAGIMVATVIVLNVLFKKSKMTDGIIEKTWDSKTDAKIQTLHPLLRPIASKFINEVEKRLGKKIKITDGYRTFAEQNKLYAQGRTTAGKIVTNAKGGQSYHNYGLAFDCYFTNNGVIDFKTPITPAIAQIGQELGLTWGGNFKSIKDFPHFQLTKGTESELLAKYNAGKKDSAGYVIV